MELKGDLTHDSIFLERDGDGDLKVFCRQDGIFFAQQQEEQLLEYLCRCAKMEQRQRPLRTVDAHNAAKRLERETWERRMSLTSVACPKCGKELLWANAKNWMMYKDGKMRQAVCTPCSLVIDLEMA